jgi:ribosomal protein S18 acetylase RimI-like enzyme
MDLHGRIARDLDDADWMRIVRNECCEFMTRDTKYISFDAQHRWWENLDRTKTTPVLFWAENAPVGYGIVRLDDEQRYWLTGGLLEDWRRAGLGEKLFRWLMTFVKDLTGQSVCWLEVRESNNAALKLYKKLGFEEASSKDGILTMVKK